MNITKIIASVSLSAFALVLLAPISASAAENDVKIKNNGDRSWNSAWLVNKKKSMLMQLNETRAKTNIGVYSNTGDNKTSNNTGKNSLNSVESGDSETTVKVNVKGGANKNTDNCDCEQTSTNATISGNGANSNNSVVVVNKSKKSTYQSNSTFAKTNIGVASNTGGNSANNNTGGGSFIMTGDSTTTANVSVSGSSNTSN